LLHPHLPLPLPPHSPRISYNSGPIQRGRRTPYRRRRRI
jgi:hypothetical protein